jgi:polar amino acid transport system substrate-binding protein
MERTFPCLSASLLALALFFFNSSPVSAQAVQEIVTRGELKIGYIPAPPGTIRDPMTNELSGFYVEGIREIARQMGVKPVFVETTWGNFVAGLQSGQFDMAIAGTFATVQRSMSVTFTKPIFYLGYGALVRVNDDRYKSLADVNSPGTRIAVVQGGAAEDYARRTFPKAQVITLATGNLTAGFIEVASGRADVSVEDGVTMDAFVARQPGVKNLYSEKPYNFTPIAWSVRKGNMDLVGVLNTGIDVLQSSGRWDEIARAQGLSAGVRYIDAPNIVAFPRAPAGG